MSPSSVCTRTRTGLCAAGVCSARTTIAAAAIAVTIERARRIATGMLEAIDGAELELPARIRTARRLAEIGVAEDADVAVGGEVLVVEQVEHIGAHFNAVLLRQREGAREREVRIADRCAARGVPALRRRRVAGPLRGAEHLRRAGHVLRVADRIGIAALGMDDAAHAPVTEHRAAS